MSAEPTRRRTLAIGSLIALTIGVTATFLWGQRHRDDAPPPSISAIGALPRERANAGQAWYEAKVTQRGRDDLARALAEMNRQAAEQFLAREGDSLPQPVQ